MAKINIKILLVGILFFILISLGVFRYFYNEPDKNNIPDEKIYQCSDGIDNDGDGFIDFSNGVGDPDCKSDTDNLEKQIPSLLWLLFLLLSCIFIYLGYLYYKKNNNSDNQNDSLDKFKLQSAIGRNRAFELAISDFLRNIAKDISTHIVIEDDGYYLVKPDYAEDIIETDRFARHFKSPHLYQISDIMVHVGKHIGCWRLIYCITNGEQRIKDGIDRFEKGTNKYNHQMKTRTYNMESPATESSLIKHEMIDAMRDGDLDTKSEMQEMLRTFGSGSSFSDETDDEYQTRLKIQQMNKNKKKYTNTKKNKASIGVQQPTFEKQEQSNEGDEE